MRMLLFVLCCMPFLLAFSTQELFTAQEITLKLNVSSTINVNDNVGAEMDYVKAELSFVPLTSNQQTVNVLNTPSGRVEEDIIKYQWERDEIKKVLPLGYESIIQVKNYHPFINQKIPFPIESLPNELLPFIEPSETIDADNAEIIKLASTLAEGQDDLYMLTNTFGVWVTENIQYNLSSYTEKASLPASWVLDNRRGVCDELTNLFIAMLRSVGIPARFVTGVAFTNSELFPRPK